MTDINALKAANARRWHGMYMRASRIAQFKTRSERLCRIDHDEAGDHEEQIDAGGSDDEHGKQIARAVRVKFRPQMREDNDERSGRPKDLN